DTIIYSNIYIKISSDFFLRVLQLRQHNMSFHLEEYRALRNEILLYTRRETLVLFYISVVNAGVLSWVIASLNNDLQFKGPILVAAVVPIFLLW
ncbi:MAG: hypothetical protein KTR19_01010, partial [Hyphomicrobiales bacterium]|nr:hypothetical protein [Hyphomicrobiales bacterium]